MARAKLVIAIELGLDDLLLPVGIIETAVRVVAEGVQGEVIDDGLHQVAFHNLGEALVVVVNIAPFDGL